MKNEIKAVYKTKNGGILLTDGKKFAWTNIGIIREAVDVDLGVDFDEVFKKADKIDLPSYLEGKISDFGYVGNLKYGGKVGVRFWNGLKEITKNFDNIFDENEKKEKNGFLFANLKKLIGIEVEYRAVDFRYLVATK